MLNIRLVCVGKIKDSFNKDGINEYLKRLSRYAKVEIVEVDDVKIKDNASLKEEENVLHCCFLGLCICYCVSQKLPVQNNQFTGLLLKINLLGTDQEQNPCWEGCRAVEGASPWGWWGLHVFPCFHPHLTFLSSGKGKNHSQRYAVVPIPFLSNILKTVHLCLENQALWSKERKKQQV